MIWELQVIGLLILFYCLYCLISCSMKTSYFKQLEKYTESILHGKECTLSQNVTSCRSSSLHCTPVMCMASWATPVTHRYSALRPDGHAPGDSPLCCSGQHDPSVTEVILPLTANLAFHGPPSLTTWCPLFIRDVTLGFPFIQEGFLAIPMPTDPSGDPTPVSPQLWFSRGGSVDVLSHVCTFSI